MKYICGLDIGSSKIAACLGSFRQKELGHLWWDSAVASGIKHGQWQDVEGMTVALCDVFKNLKKKSGVKIKSVYLGVAGQNIIAKHSQAVIAMAERGNKSVTKRDIYQVNHQAQILGSCLGEEILHAEPLSYNVDNENETMNPLGLYGHQLKVNLYMVCTSSTFINTAIEAVNRLGVKINGITLSGMAVSQAVFNINKMKGVSILCDIGKDITQILIFKEGRCTHYQIVHTGGDELTESLISELNLSRSLAEEVKISYGSIQSSDEIQDKEIIVKKDGAYSTLSQKLVIQTLTRQSRCVAEKIRDCLRPHLLAMPLPVLPDKVTLYVSGRTACLDGFLELLEVIVGMPVMMAKIGNPSLLEPLMRHRVLSGKPILNYLACFGLITYADNLPYKRLSPKHDFRSLLSSIPERIREVYQEYF